MEMINPGIITKYLSEKGKGIIELEQEVSDSKGNYLAFDDGGVECEVGELLYSFVRVIKPQSVLTTGIYTGVSDMYIGQALVDNGFGTSDALEYEQKHIERAKKLWMQVEVDKVINEHLISSLEFKPNRNYDFMFLDTELNLRFHELVRYCPYLNPGSYVLIHDMPINLCQGNISADHPDFKHWPVGEIPQQVKDWVKGDQLRPIYFPNPRGMVGFYKTREDEYKW